MTVRLGHLDHMDYRHPNPEDHPKVKWEKSLCLDHANMPIFGHLAKTQFTNDHLRSNSIDTLLVPKLDRGKIWDHLDQLSLAEHSLSTFGIFAFLKILFYKVWDPCGIFVLLCSSHRYKPSGGNLVPFGAPSNRERDDATRVAP